SGTATLVNSANNYQGGTTVTGGALSASTDGALGLNTGSVTLNGGSFRFDANFTFNSNRSFILGAGNGTIDTQAFTSPTIAGPIGGPGSLTKIGSGSLTLTNANYTWSSGTNISGGFLKFFGAGNLPPGGDVNINPGLGATAALDISGANNNQTIGALSSTA